MPKKIKISLILILVCLICVYVIFGGEAQRHIRSLRSLTSANITDYDIRVCQNGPENNELNDWIYVNDDVMKAAIFRSTATVKYTGKRDYLKSLNPDDDPYSIQIIKKNHHNDLFHIIVSNNVERNVVRYSNMEIIITGAEDLRQIVETFYATMN